MASTPTSSAGRRLATRAPFHLEATVRVLQRRPTNPVDVWDEARYLRAWPTPQGLALIEVANHGAVDAPQLGYRVLCGEVTGDAHAGIRANLRRVLGLDLTPEPLQRIAQAACAHDSTAVALRGLRPPCFASLFEGFANVVPFQQLSLDAGVAIVRRLVERFGAHLDHQGCRYHAFPDARVVAHARVGAIAACGLSRRKAETLHQLAKAVESGNLTAQAISRMSSTDAIRSLTALPGIGPWSANLFLLRGLGRLDVFPPGDVGAVRGLVELTGLPASSLDGLVERFGDHRGYLYFLSLGGRLLAKNLIRPAPAQ